jgi:hypothetical protein
VKLQIRTGLFIGVSLIILVGAFWSGFGLANFETHQVTTYTTFTMVTTVHTNVTYVQISGTNHSIFYVTEVAVEEPVLTNEICVLFAGNTTLSTTYILPTTGLNGPSPIGSVTTSISYDNYTTNTIYENVTMISNGSSCTLINPYYGTQSSNCPECA